MPPVRCSAARGFFQAAFMISPLESPRCGLRAGLHVELELRTAGPQPDAVQVESVWREVDDVQVVDVESRQFDQTVGCNFFVRVPLLGDACANAGCSWGGARFENRLTFWHTACRNTRILFSLQQLEVRRNETQWD